MRSRCLGATRESHRDGPGRVWRKSRNSKASTSQQAKFNPPQPGSVGEIQATFEQSVREVESCLEGMSNETARGDWRLSNGDRELFIKPRMSVMRSIMLNHWYHHRGQLSVYLRLLDVPVPVVYGPSADENPFV